VNLSSSLSRMLSTDLSLPKWRNSRTT
jgi:hypothetical protein